jgi:hypothetical protein
MSHFKMTHATIFFPQFSRVFSPSSLGLAMLLRRIFISLEPRIGISAQIYNNNSEVRLAQIFG